jgi:hypothetical protein
LKMRAPVKGRELGEAVDVSMSEWHNRGCRGAQGYEKEL